MPPAVLPPPELPPPELEPPPEPFGSPGVDPVVEPLFGCEPPELGVPML
jgi:hypothetical protein